MLSRRSLPLLFALSLLSACGKEKVAPAPPYDVERLLEERQAKDRYLVSSPDSPIPDSIRRGFAGLSYYPPDTSLRFSIALDRLSGEAPISIPASGGETRTMTRYGRFHFTVGDSTCTLTAYLSAENPRSLFVPFIDATSGTETYEAGRYLDLDRTPDDRYLLDFNRAYNPYCAYNASYSCPRVPRENVLQIPIRAGERGGAH